MANNNRKVIPQSASALDQMKFEIASELGIPNYSSMDKGDLPARVNGYVGGNITKRLVALGEQYMVQDPQRAMGVAQSVSLETPRG